jgi:hypothetical protein
VKCERSYEWPDPDPADVLPALLGAIGDMERGLPPKTGDLLVIFAFAGDRP